MIKKLFLLIATVALLSSLLPTIALAAPAQKTTIEFWHAMRGEKQTAIETLCKDFMAQNRGIEVKPMAIVSPDRRTNGNDYTYLYKQMIQAIALGKQPDVAQVYENWTTQFVDIKVITPVSHFNNTNYAMTNEEKNDFYPIFRDAVTYNGDMWAIPFNKSIYVMYYNKNIFNKYNLTPPTNWNDLKKVVEKLSAINSDYYGLAFQPSVDMLGHILYSNGGEFITGNKVAFSGKSGMDAINYWVSLAKISKVTLSSTNAYKEFASGKAAIYIDTTSRIGGLRQDCNFEYGIAPLPTGSAKRYQTAGTNLAIFSTNEAKKIASWRLIKFMTQKENIVKLAMATGYLPTKQSALKNENYQKYLNQNSGYKVGLDELKYGVSQPRTSAWESIRGFINDAMYEAVAMNVSSEDAMKKAAGYSSELLKGVQ